jgi:hypothetical protein
MGAPERSSDRLTSAALPAASSPKSSAGTAASSCRMEFFWRELRAPESSDGHRQNPRRVSELCCSRRASSCGSVPRRRNTRLRNRSCPVLPARALLSEPFFRPGRGSAARTVFPWLTPWAILFRPTGDRSSTIGRTSLHFHDEHRLVVESGG